MYAKEKSWSDFTIYVFSVPGNKKKKTKKPTNLPWGTTQNRLGPKITACGPRADSWEPGNFDRTSGKYQWLEV